MLDERVRLSVLLLLKIFLRFYIIWFLPFRFLFRYNKNDRREWEGEGGFSFSGCTEKERERRVEARVFFSGNGSRGDRAGLRLVFHSRPVFQAIDTFLRYIYIYY